MREKEIPLSRFWTVWMKLTLATMRRFLVWSWNIHTKWNFHQFFYMNHRTYLNIKLLFFISPFNAWQQLRSKRKNRMTDSCNKLSQLKKLKKKQVKISMKEISKINNQCNLNTCSIRNIIVELQFNYSQSGWHHPCYWPNVELLSL